MDAGWPLEISNEIKIDACILEYRLIKDEDEKFLLMEGILYALDELTNENDFKYYSDQVSNLLKIDFDIHKFTIYYWTLYDDTEIDAFNITPLLREIWDNQKN
jgi:hypothetical protein